MFEYFLAGFTGSFFSYFCVYSFGVVSEGIAKDSLSTMVVRKLNLERIEISLDNIKDVLSRHIGR